MPRGFFDAPHIPLIYSPHHLHQPIRLLRRVPRRNCERHEVIRPRRAEIAVVVVHAEWHGRLCAVFRGEHLRGQRIEMDVAVRVKQHLRDVRPRTRIAHVIQRRNPPHRQREQQVIRFIQLLLGIEGGVVQPLWDGMDRTLNSTKFGPG